MPSRAIRTTRRLAIRLGLHKDWWLYGVAALIGLGMGGIAVLFLAPLEWAEARESSIDQTLIWTFVLLAPAIGGLAVGLVRKGIKAQYVGPGVTTIIHAVLRRRSRLPMSVGVQKWICAVSPSAPVARPVPKARSSRSVVRRALHWHGVSAPRHRTPRRCWAAALPQALRQCSTRPSPVCCS